MFKFATSDTTNISTVSATGLFSLKYSGIEDFTISRVIGFPERKVVENLKASIEYKNNLIKEAVAQDEVKSVMKDAGMDFGNRKSFIGALNFLNTQASLSVINKRSKGFEAIA